MAGWTDFFTLLKLESNFFFLYLFFAFIGWTVGEVSGKGRERGRYATNNGRGLSQTPNIFDRFLSKILQIHVLDSFL